MKIVTDCAAFIDDGMRIYCGVGANGTVFANHGKRADGGVRTNHGSAGDRRQWMNARVWLGA